MADIDFVDHPDPNAAIFQNGKIPTNPNARVNTTDPNARINDVQHPYTGARIYSGSRPAATPPQGSQTPITPSNTPASSSGSGGGADAALEQAFKRALGEGPPPPATAINTDLPLLIDGGGAAISATPSTKGYLVVSWPCRITGWYVLADVSGSIVIDVLRTDYATFPSFTSIAGTSKPTLSSAQKNQDLVMTNWSVAPGDVLSRGDILRFDVSSTSTVALVLVSLRVRRLDLTAET